MRLSGVQLARPADAQQLGRRLLLIGAEHHAERRERHVKRGVGNRMAAASPSANGGAADQMRRALPIQVEPMIGTRA